MRLILMMLLALELMVPCVSSLHAAQSTLDYEIEVLDQGNPGPTLASGFVDTLPGTDTEVLLPSPEGMLWSRNVALSEGFSLSVLFMDYVPSTGVTPRLVFSLRNGQDPRGASRYGSLKLGEDGLFSGEAGRVRLVLPDSGDPQEVATVQFLEDVVVRYKRDIRDDAFSHQIVIRRGSELHLVHGTDLTQVASR